VIAAIRHATRRLVDNSDVDSCLICAEARGFDTPLAFSDEVAAAFPARLRSTRNPGAALIVTTAHHPTLDDLPTELVGPFFERVQRIALAVQHVSGADGTTLFQNNHRPGQELPHLHVHVIPRFMGDEWPLTATIEVGIEERTQCAERLRAALEAQ
jgi:histidine triad (HIT) family protein